jgi:hypothetical protein
MRKLMLAAIVALSLGGCATTQPGGTPTPISEQVNQAIAVAQQVCGFVPTFATVVSMFNAGFGSAFEVASAVCAAIRPQPGARVRPGRPIACARRCVAIRGSFVR